MNRLNFDEPALENKWVFMSVFCSREEWHVLLGAIRKRLVVLRKDGLALEKTFVYLSLRRGPSIRLALYFKKVTEEDCRAVEKSIDEILAKNPSAVQAGGMPIGSFFMDFPHHQVKYNLFDEVYILPRGLEHIQGLLSTILCKFFEDHPVDGEGIFTLLIYLQREIIEHAFSKASERMEFCSHIVNDLARDESDKVESSSHREEFRQPVVFQETEGQEDVFDLLSRFGEACAALCRSDRDAVKVYTTLLHLIQLHLFKIPRQEFLTSLSELPVFFNH